MFRYKIVLVGLILVALVATWPGPNHIQAQSPLTFNPVADAYVSLNSPDTNYGTETVLEVDSPGFESYMRFDVSGVSGTVNSAMLYVYVSNGSTDGPGVYGTDNTWGETTLTWNNKPAATTGELANIGDMQGGWRTYDLTSHITGDATYNLLLLPDSSNGVTIHSREGSNPPYLEISYTAGATATPTNTATPTPTVTQTPTPTPTPSDSYIDAGQNIVGEIRLYAGDDEPDCWLFARGQSLSSAVYSELFGVVGSLYGGDSATFLLPDLRARVPVGYVGPGNGDGAFATNLAEVGGEYEHTLTVDEMPAHTHQPDTSSGSGLVAWELGAGSYSFFSGNNVKFTTLSSAGGGQPHNNLQPYLTVNFIIYTGHCLTPTPSPTATPTPVVISGGPLTGTLTGSLTITEAVANAYTYTLDTNNQFYLIRRATYGDVLAGAGGVMLLMVVVAIGVVKLTGRRG